MKKRISPLVKFLLVVVPLVALVMELGFKEHYYKPAGWTIDLIARQTVDRIQWGAADAIADGPTSGLSAGGSAMGGACWGIGTLSSGLLTQIAPCMGTTATNVYHYCEAFYTINGTPAVGALSCAPTTTTTTTGSPAATVTVSAVSLTQSSPAGAPTILWVAGPQ